MPRPPNVVTKRIDLSLIDPNPFRDLTTNPLDKDHVDRLKKSIQSTGFWDGCQVREHGKRYQLLFGHSRIEAARQMKVTSSVFTVRDVDDDTALRMMVDENVTQFGRDAFAVYREAVTAACSRIMLISLGKVEDSQQLLGTLKLKRDDIAKGGCPGEACSINNGNKKPETRKRCPAFWLSAPCR